MTIEELHEAQRKQLQTECENLLRLHAEDAIESDGMENAGGMLQETFRHLERYQDVHQLTKKQMNNIMTLFRDDRPDNGIYGFIDTALMFQNGKTGVLFRQADIACRGMGDSENTSLTYRQLCSSLISSKKEFPLASYKMRVEPLDQELLLIKAGDQAKEIIHQLRTSLFYYEPQARSAFYKAYAALIHRVLQLADNQPEQAGKQVEWLNQLCEDYPYEQYYPVPYQLTVLLKMLQDDYEAALKTAEAHELADWTETVKKDQQTYHEILAGEICTAARKAFENKETEKALELTEKSLQQKSTENGWQLFVDILIASANKENYYQRDSFSDFMEDAEKEPEQLAVIERNKDRLEQLKKNIEAYQKELRESIPEKVLAEDKSFFLSNKDVLLDYVNEQNMNALSVAALYHKTEILELLKKQGYNAALKAFDLYTPNKLYALFCKDWKDYFKVMGKQDPEAAAIDKKCREAVDKAERNVRSEKRWSAVSGIAMVATAKDEAVRQLVDADEDLNSTVFQASSGIYEQSQNDLAKAEKALAEVQKESDELHQKHFRSVQDEFRSVIGSLLRLKFYQLPELPEDTTEQEYRKAVAIVPPLFEKYLTKETEKGEKAISPKGEFETTDAYQKRYAKEKDMVRQKSIRPAYLASKEICDRLDRAMPPLRKMIKRLFEYQEPVMLESYDADHQVFAAKWKGFYQEVSLSIEVAPADAPDFKKQYGTSGIPVKVDEFSGKTLFTAVCHASVNDHNYSFELKQ